MTTIYDFIGEHLVLTASLIIIIYFVFVFFLWPYFEKKGIIKPGPKEEPKEEEDQENKEIIKKEEI